MYSIRKVIFDKPHILLIVFFTFLFFMTAPWTVQGGDTGELVSNSYFLRVSHPPGYPLWTLLFHLPVKYLTFISPFHAAALFSSFISILWIAVLLFRFKNIESLCVVFLSASSLLIWKYSVLPDVFSLHLFFLVLVFLAFMAENLPVSLKLIFFISLSMAHHHTIIFAFPLFLYSVCQKLNWKIVIYSFFFALVSLSFYFAILFFNPEELGSWGVIKNISDLSAHFFRREYGTFKLQTFQNLGNYTFLGLFIKQLFTDFWSLIFIFVYILFKHFGSLRQNYGQLCIIFFSLFAYFFVFDLAGVRHVDDYGALILERFLLQPFIYIVFAILLIINHGKIHMPRWLILTILVNCGLNVVQNFRPNDFSSNTTIEDFGVNILKNLPPNSIYYPKGDTAGFSTYYIHDVLKIRRDIVLFQPSIMFPWSALKTATNYPQAFSLKKSLFDGINFEDFQYFTNVAPTNVPLKIQVSFFGPIYKFHKVALLRPEVSYDCDVTKQFNWRSRPGLRDFELFETSLLFDLNYGQCHFLLANKLSSESKTSEAIKLAEKAVDLSPFNIHFQKFLCQLYKTEGLKDKVLPCLDRLEALDEAIHPAYR
jgi:hypothetical protein